LALAGCSLAPLAAGAAAAAEPTLQSALDQLVSMPGGPPGAIAVIQHDGQTTVVQAGTGQLGATAPIQASDHLRLASVSKAFSGAVALSLVSDGVLHLSDAVGRWLPWLPSAWEHVTLAELLGHTSGIPDFSGTKAFQTALVADPQTAPAPYQLIEFAVGVCRDDPARCLSFTPGTAYAYSNSDNVIIGLMVAAATGQSYEAELQSRVLDPLGLAGTSLPPSSAMPSPFVHGYDGTDDVTSLFAADWAWSAGGVVATPTDTLAFIRAYVAGTLVDQATHQAQFSFRAGTSEPPGPGENSAGLAVFRYQTSCGTVYGHTGNTAGYTNFAAASADGRDAVVVSVNAQVSLKVDPVVFAALRSAEGQAVCQALAG